MKQQPTGIHHLAFMAADNQRNVEVERRLSALEKEAE